MPLLQNLRNEKESWFQKGITKNGDVVKITYALFIPPYVVNIIFHVMICFLLHN